MRGSFHPSLSQLGGENSSGGAETPTENAAKAVETIYRTLSMAQRVIDDSLVDLKPFVAVHFTSR